MANGSTTTEQRIARRNAVAVALASTLGLSRANGAAVLLAEQFGVDESTIWADRRWLLKQAGGTLDDPKAVGAEFLLRLRRAQESAAQDGAHGPLMSGMGLEAKVLGVLAADRVEIQHSTSKDRALPAALYETIERVWGMSQRGELDEMTAPELWAQFETAMGERMAIDAPEAIDVGGL